MSAPPTRFGLILAQLDLPTELEDEFNDWYDTEHIPERLGLPGFRTGRRAERAPFPRYIATYDLDGLVVLESAEYKGCSGVNRSPWTARMLKKTRKFDRRLYEQVLPGNEDVAQAHAHTALRFLPEKDVDRARLDAHLIEVRQQHGATARLFSGREKAAHEYLVFYTAQTAELAAALARAPFGGATEVYGPYVRVAS